MKKILTIMWLACGVALTPVAFAADEAPKDQKSDQKTSGDKKNGNAGDAGEKKDEKKKDGGGAEPECS